MQNATKQHVIVKINLRCTLCICLKIYSSCSFREQCTFIKVDQVPSIKTQRKKNGPHSVHSSSSLAWIYSTASLNQMPEIVIWGKMDVTTPFYMVNYRVIYFFSSAAFYTVKLRSEFLIRCVLHCKDATGHVQCINFRISRYITNMCFRNE